MSLESVSVFSYIRTLYNLPDQVDDLTLLSVLYVVFEREFEREALFHASTMPLKLQEYHSYRSLIPCKKITRKSMLECTLDYMTKTRTPTLEHRYVSASSNPISNGMFAKCHACLGSETDMQ